MPTNHWMGGGQEWLRLDSCWIGFPLASLASHWFPIGCWMLDRTLDVGSDHSQYAIGSNIGYQCWFGSLDRTNTIMQLAPIIGLVHWIHPMIQWTIGNQHWVGSMVWSNDPMSQWEPTMDTIGLIHWVDPLGWTIGLIHWFDPLGWSIGLDCWFDPMIQWTIGSQYWVGSLVWSNDPMSHWEPILGWIIGLIHDPMSQWEPTMDPSLHWFIGLTQWTNSMDQGNGTQCWFCVGLWLIGSSQQAITIPAPPPPLMVCWHYVGNWKCRGLEPVTPTMAQGGK